MPLSNFLKIFSVTTIPSSTTSPVARTIARRVSIFIENPKRYIIKKVDINDIGMSIRGRRAISQLQKNKKITIITIDNAIARVCFTSVNDFRTLLVLSIRVVKTVSYTHLRAHETDSYLVCRLLLEKKK